MTDNIEKTDAYRQNEVIGSGVISLPQNGLRAFLFGIVIALLMSLPSLAICLCFAGHWIWGIIIFILWFSAIYVKIKIDMDDADLDDNCC